MYLLRVFSGLISLVQSEVKQGFLCILGIFDKTPIAYCNWWGWNNPKESGTIAACLEVISAIVRDYQGNQVQDVQAKSSHLHIHQGVSTTTQVVNNLRIISGCNEDGLFKRNGYQLSKIGII